MSLCDRQWHISETNYSKGKVWIENRNTCPHWEEGTIKKTDSGTEMIPDINVMDKKSEWEDVCRSQIFWDILKKWKKKKVWAEIFCILELLLLLLINFGS